MGNPGRPEARRQPPFSALLVSLNHNPFALFGFAELMLVFMLAQGAWLAKYVGEK
jgi:hypothetical protein